jgi:hypothetical protein
MKYHSPAGYAVAIAGAAVLVYIAPPKMRLAVVGLALVGGMLLLRGGIDGLKSDLTGGK